VEVVSAPPAGGDFAKFQPDFGRYRAIVMNYDAPDGRWPEPLKASFEQYVEQGGGLVIVHGADNAFPRWKAFNAMNGLGGWRNRNPQSGPYWYFRDGQLVSDPSPGPTGSHGQRLPFLITKRAEHPITQGLPATWMHGADELYAQPSRNRRSSRASWLIYNARRRSSTRSNCHSGHEHHLRSRGCFELNGCED
jgi:uncharacterized protein